jgi:hypothetical protein
MATRGAPALRAELSTALQCRGSLSADVDDVADRALAEIAPELDPKGADAVFLRRAILRGFATFLDERMAIERGDLTPVPSAAAISPAVEPRRVQRMPFLAKWKVFEDAKLAEKAWDPSTAANSRGTQRLFAGFYGDKSVAEIDRKLAADLRARLFRMPKFYDKSFGGRAPDAAIAEADRRDATRAAGEPAIPRLQLATVDKHYSNLIEYWRWLAKTGLIPHTLECPFSGFIQAKAQGRAARDKRLQWPLPMQATLFSSPVWTGCKSLHRRGTPGPEIHRDALFWLPILGRVLGAREDEICGRLVGDIRLESDIEYPPGETGRDAIWYLHIDDSKTAGSTRDLPLPDLILSLGFLEYRYFGRDPGAALFPELIPQGPASSRAAAFTGRFTEYRRKVGVPTESRFPFA